MLSPADLAFCAYALRLARNSYGISKADCRVVVPTGVYTLEISDRFVRDTSLTKSYDSRIKEFERASAAILLGKDRAFDYSPANERNFPELNKKFAERCSNEMWKIKFNAFLGKDL